jgi:hypothetical protein
MREQHDPTVGKLKGIVVRVRIVQVHLPKPSHRVIDMFRLPLEKAQLKSRNLMLDRLLERDLGARKKAHGHLRLSNGGKPASRGIPKLRRDQLISDRRWPGCNMVEAVITHGMELLSVSAPPTCSIFQKIHGQIMKPEQPHRPRLDNRGLHRPFRPPGPIDRSR